MANLDVLDSSIRLAAAGAFLMIGMAILGSRPRQPVAWVGPVFFLAAAGHALTNCTMLRLGGDIEPLVTIAWGFGAVGVGFFWLFVMALFEDEASMPPWRLALVVGQFGLALVGRYSPHPMETAAWTVFHVVSLAMLAMAFAAIWRSARNDLVEPRRRLRAPIMAAAAAYILLIATTDLAATYGVAIHGLRLVGGVALLLLALAAAAVLTRLDPVLVASSERPRATPADAPDATALGRLTKAMDEEQVWRREDLTIGALADHVGLPEHRLRRLINGELGHRNFAAFVNARRIAAAKSALRDPAQARTSVSAIAYELGFGSLGPFNRAFKDATGVTPTVWRASPISESLAET